MLAAASRSTAVRSVRIAPAGTRLHSSCSTTYGKLDSECASLRMRARLALDSELPADEEVATG